MDTQVHVPFIACLRSRIGQFEIIITNKLIRLNLSSVAGNDAYSSMNLRFKTMNGLMNTDVHPLIRAIRDSGRAYQIKICQVMLGIIFFCRKIPEEIRVLRHVRFYAAICLIRLSKFGSKQLQSLINLLLALRRAFAVNRKLKQTFLVSSSYREACSWIFYVNKQTQKSVLSISGIKPHRQCIFIVY